MLAEEESERPDPEEEEGSCMRDWQWLPAELLTLIGARLPLHDMMLATMSCKNCQASLPLGVTQLSHRIDDATCLEARQHSTAGWTGLLRAAASRLPPSARHAELCISSYLLRPVSLRDHLEAVAHMTQLTSLTILQDPWNPRSELPSKPPPTNSRLRRRGRTGTPPPTTMPRASPYTLAPLTALTDLRSLTLHMVLRDDFTKPLSELRALTRLELAHVDQEPYSLRFELKQHRRADIHDLLCLTNLVELHMEAGLVSGRRVARLSQLPCLRHLRLLHLRPVVCDEGALSRLGDALGRLTQLERLTVQLVTADCTLGADWEATQRDGLLQFLSPPAGQSLAVPWELAMPTHVAPLPANPDVLRALCAAGGRVGGGGSGGALRRLVLRLGRETPDPWEQYRREQQQEGEEGEADGEGQDGELEQLVEGGGEGEGGDPWTMWRRRRAAPRWSWGMLSSFTSLTRLALAFDPDMPPADTPTAAHLRQWAAAMPSLRSLSLAMQAEAFMSQQDPRSEQPHTGSHSADPTSVNPHQGHGNAGGSCGPGMAAGGPGSRGQDGVWGAGCVLEVLPSFRALRYLHLTAHPASTQKRMLPFEELMQLVMRLGWWGKDFAARVVQGLIEREREQQQQQQQQQEAGRQGQEEGEDGPQDEHRGVWEGQQVRAEEEQEQEGKEKEGQQEVKGAQEEEEDEEGEWVRYVMGPGGMEMPAGMLSDLRAAQLLQRLLFEVGSCGAAMELGHLLMYDECWAECGGKAEQVRERMVTWTEEAMREHSGPDMRRRAEELIDSILPGVEQLRTMLSGYFEQGGSDGEGQGTGRAGEPGEEGCGGDGGGREGGAAVVAGDGGGSSRGGGGSSSGDGGGDTGGGGDGGGDGDGGGGGGSSVDDKQGGGGGGSGSESYGGQEGADSFANCKQDGDSDDSGSSRGGGGGGMSAMPVPAWLMFLINMRDAPAREAASPFQDPIMQLPPIPPPTHESWDGPGGWQRLTYRWKDVARACAFHLQVMRQGARVQDSLLMDGPGFDLGLHLPPGLRVLSLRGFHTITSGAGWREWQEGRGEQQVRGGCELVRLRVVAHTPYEKVRVMGCIPGLRLWGPLPEGCVTDVVVDKGWRECEMLEVGEDGAVGEGEW